MFELSVSMAIENQNLLQELCKKLMPEIKREGGVCAVINSGVRSNFALAVDSKKKEYYKAKILDFVTQTITGEYKFNFFKNCISNINDDVICQSFLKAIAIFDCETDRQFIKNQLQLSGEIVLDSFYYFKLEPLRARWAKTAGIINQNGIIKSRTSMIEVLKYLTTMSDNSCVTTKVKLGKKQIKLKNIDFSKTFLRTQEGISDFFTDIIKLNPMKIDVELESSGSASDDIYEFLSQIFYDKVYITT